MRRKAIAVLTVLSACTLGFEALSEAQVMDANQGLSSKQQGMVTISAFTANGGVEKLKTALHEGLDSGLTVNEIKEILVQLYAYTGFPRSLNALGTFMGVMEERQKKGIKDELGKEPSPFPAGKSSVELGTEIQTRLVDPPA
ncbi:MAG: carboxymuconolactone decarboxylase family protein, partial [Syntrophobacteraceae bacterium]|nr:carboxymuconolactone decarboxylase family protein [Syntrophobacteraceae bacterium]